MRNDYKLNSDGTYINLTLHLNSTTKGKVVLSIIVSILVGVLVYLPFSFPIINNPNIILPIIVFAIIIFVFPIRYLFWNLYGKEHIIINKKKLIIGKDYGVYITNLETQQFERLHIEFERTKTFEEIKFGNLIFKSFNKDPRLSKYIYSSSINLELEVINEIKNEIAKLDSNIYFSKTTDEVLVQKFITK